MSAQPKSVRILLFEDESVSGSGTLESLASEGHDLVASDDVDQALHIARVLLPDVIVLDVRPPPATGLSVLRKLRAEEGLDCVPVVTVSDAADDEEEALEAGAVLALHRPLSHKQLSAAVSRASGSPLPHVRLWGRRQ